MTGSGGAGVVASDRCEEYGMQLPPLSDTTLERLRGLLPGFAAASNPVDISGQRSQTGRSVSNGALEIVLDDDVTDQVIVRSKQSTNRPENALELAQIARRAGKPVLVALGADHDVEATRVLDAQRIPWHVTMPRAAVAAKALNEFARKLRRHDRHRSSSERAVARQALGFPAGATTLSEHDSKRVLSAYGMPVVREVLLTLGAVETLRGPLRFRSLSW